MSEDDCPVCIREIPDGKDEHIETLINVFVEAWQRPPVIETQGCRTKTWIDKSSFRYVIKDKQHVSIVDGKGEDARFEKLKNENNDDLKVFVQFRKRFINAFLDKLKAILDLECDYDAGGSVLCTSDYDVTLSGSGRERLCITFNTYFQYIFECSSAELFDTNIYGSNPFNIYNQSKKVEVDQSKEHVFEFTYKRCPKKIIYDTLTTIDETIQHKWAFIKLNHYRSKFFEDNLWFKQQENGIELNSLNCVKHQPIQDQNNYYSCVLYELLDYTERNEVFLEDTENKDVDRNYQDLMCKSLAYAQEGYYTYGALFHVVLGIQFGINFDDLKEFMYFDSFIENAGDFFKALPDKETEISVIAIKVSKYYARMLDAVTRMRLIKEDDAGFNHFKLIVQSVVSTRDQNDPNDINLDSARTQMILPLTLENEETKHTQIIPSTLENTIAGNLNNFIKIIIDAFQSKRPVKTLTRTTSGTSVSGRSGTFDSLHRTPSIAGLSGQLTRQNSRQQRSKSQNDETKILNFFPTHAPTIRRSTSRKFTERRTTLERRMSTLHRIDEP